MRAQMTFKPQEIPLSQLLEEVHRGDLQLPDFQRSWVWDDERIRDLLASLSQGWPVGAVLLLECGGEVQFKARPVEGAPLNPGRERRLILDGQQRLTSLYSTLRAEGPVRTKDSRNNDTQRLYYFDIRRCLDPNADRKDAVVSVDAARRTLLRDPQNRSDLLDLTTPEREYASLHLPVRTAFDPALSRAWRREFGRAHGHDREMIERYDQFEQEVVDVVQRYNVPAIELGRTASRQAVCMVFEKVNTGGKPLDVFELITATYAARSFDLRDDWDAREKRFAAVRLLAGKKPNEGVKQTDFLQSITLFSTWKRGASDPRVHVGCRRIDMLNLPLEEYTTHAHAIERGMVTVARILERERVFDREFLPYPIQFVPFAAIAALLGPRVDDVAVREKLLRWYWCGVFGELYSGATETRFGRDIVEVPAWIEGGPEPSTVVDCNVSPARLSTLSTRNSAAYKGFMALMLQRGARDLYSGDEISSAGFVEDEVDFYPVFPEASTAGKSEGRLAKCVLNLVPRRKHTARRMGLVKPSVYLSKVANSGVTDERVDEILVSHCIEPTSLRADDFARFVRERARRLLDEVEKLTGKPVNGRDSEETVRAFGDTVPRVPAGETHISTGKLFGQYTVLETLPAGGMSEGYKVRGPDGAVAFLKKVPTQGVAGDALRREIDIYQRLHRAESDCVLQVLGIERNDTHVALLTEFADGGTLRSYVEKHPHGLEAREAREIAATILGALRELHALDVVHRDLKPENVLRANNAWKLADFGIAKNLRRLVTQHLTFRGHGTPGFAPPEQGDGAEAAPSADVYAFGKLLVFLLTGQTDIDKLTMGSWHSLAQSCTERDPAKRPTLDQVETALAEIYV
jgi:hypothetical protein